jgi:hypothetical protein
MNRYKGGCSCGSIRYELGGRPLWITACHCDACKKRTGSAFGLSAVVEKSTVQVFSGATKTFTRKGDSGKTVEYDFCPNCGTTVRWRVEVMPGREIYAVGTLDQPGQIRPDGEYYTDAALAFARLGCDLTCPAAPNNELREALIDHAKTCADR